MNNDEYKITISYQPKHAVGQEEVSISGVTQSTTVYSQPYHVAYMHELKVGATGSTPNEALTNVLTKADTINPLNNPLSSYKTY